jgi:hypothetical protein
LETCSLHESCMILSIMLDRRLIFQEHARLSPNSLHSRLMRGFCTFSVVEAGICMWFMETQEHVCQSLVLLTMMTHNCHWHHGLAETGRSSLVHFHLTAVTATEPMAPLTAVFPRRYPRKLGFRCESVLISPLFVATGVESVDYVHIPHIGQLIARMIALCPFITVTCAGSAARFEKRNLLIVQWRNVTRQGR